MISDSLATPKLRAKAGDSLATPACHVIAEGDDGSRLVRAFCHGEVLSLSKDEDGSHQRRPKTKADYLKFLTSSARR